MDGGDGALADIIFGGCALPPMGALKTATSNTTERVCQAEGCTAQLVGKYSCSRRLCSLHLRANHLRKRGAGNALFRFCQQCGKLQPLDAFDGGKRSCRERLRRRCQSSRTRADGTAAGAGRPTRGAAAGDACFDAAAYCHNSCDDNALHAGSAFSGGWSEQLPGCGSWCAADADASMLYHCTLGTVSSDDAIAVAAPAAPVSADALHATRRLPASASVGALDTLLLHDQAGAAATGDSAQLEEQLRAVQAQLVAVNQRLMRLHHQKREGSSPPALQHQLSAVAEAAHPQHAPTELDAFIPFVAAREAPDTSSSGSLAAAHFSAPNALFYSGSTVHPATTPLSRCATWQALPAAATAAGTRTRRKSVRFDDPSAAAAAAAAAEPWCAAAPAATKSAPLAGHLVAGDLGMPPMWQELLLEDLGAEESSCEHITSTDVLLPLAAFHSEPAMARAPAPAVRAASASSAAASAHTGAWAMLQQPHHQRQQLMEQVVQHTQQLQKLSLASAGALPGARGATSTPLPPYALSPTSCTTVAAVASPPAAVVPAGRLHSAGVGGVAPAVPPVSGAAAVRHQHSADAADATMEEFEDYLEIALLEAGAAALNNNATAQRGA